MDTGIPGSWLRESGSITIFRWKSTGNGDAAPAPLCALKTNTCTRGAGKGKEREGKDTCDHTACPEGRSLSVKSSCALMSWKVKDKKNTRKGMPQLLRLALHAKVARQRWGVRAYGRSAFRRTYAVIMYSTHYRIYYILYTWFRQSRCPYVNTLRVRLRLVHDVASSGRVIVVVHPQQLVILSNLAVCLLSTVVYTSTLGWRLNDIIADGSLARLPLWRCSQDMRTTGSFLTRTTR